ncbi:hypothetical protein P8452_56524 [Trifolium repens]|nr:hypothetical protein P8452_56524 [Trifolium repens]
MIKHWQSCLPQLLSLHLLEVVHLLNRCFLCTVGSVYIKSKEALAKNVLKYLVEMCCGIQNLAPVKHHFHIISAIVKVRKIQYGGILIQPTLIEDKKNF